MKLETGTGWFPCSRKMGASNMASKWPLGRLPRYFWPRCLACKWMGTFSCGRTSVAAGRQREAAGGETNQLLREGDLLQLELVDAGLGGSRQQRSCGDEGARLHDGRSGRNKVEMRKERRSRRKANNKTMRSQNR